MQSRTTADPALLSPSTGHDTHRLISPARVVAVLLCLVATLGGCSSSGSDPEPARTSETVEGADTPATTASTVIDYTDHGQTGVVLTRTGDVDKLTGSPDEFMTFIAGQVRRAITEAGDRCPSAFTGVFVQAIRTEPDGVAVGGVNTCGGYGALWANAGGRWHEVFGTQEGWDCEVLRRYDVPGSFVDNICLDYDGDGKNHPYP